MSTPAEYSLWIAPRGDGKTYRALDALSLHLQKAFAQIGHQVPIATRFSELCGRTVVFGPHRIIEHPTFFVPKNAILINTEHFTKPLQKWQRQYAEVLRQFEVWDFSHRNINILNDIGIQNVKFLELGALGNGWAYPSKEKDIDILFYGVLSERRNKILTSLGRKGVRITRLFNVFGEALYDAISRSTIVLNIHRVEQASFEMLRMLDLLPYAQFVISEKGSDPWLERRFKDGVVFSSLDGLAEVCKSYLNDQDECRRIGKRGQAAFESVKQADALKTLLS